MSLLCQEQMTNTFKPCAVKYFGGQRGSPRESVDQEEEVNNKGNQDFEYEEPTFACEGFVRTRYEETKQKPRSRPLADEEKKFSHDSGSETESKVIDSNISKIYKEIDEINQAYTHIKKTAYYSQKYNQNLSSSINSNQSHSNQSHSIYTTVTSNTKEDLNAIRKKLLESNRICFEGSKSLKSSITGSKRFKHDQDSSNISLQEFKNKSQKLNIHKKPQTANLPPNSEDEIPRKKILLSISSSKAKQKEAKPQPKGYKGIYERQKEWAENLQKKRQQELDKKKNIKDENCTFKPKINDYSPNQAEKWKEDSEYESPKKAPKPWDDSRDQTVVTERDKNQSRNSSFYCKGCKQKESTKNTQEKDLLDYYKRSMNWLKQKEAKRKIMKEREEKKLDEYTFVPNTNNHMRSRSHHDAGASGGTSFIQRNKEWIAKKQEKQDIKKQEKIQKENEEMKSKYNGSVSQIKRRSSNISRRTQRQLHEDSNPNDSLSFAYYNAENPINESTVSRNSQGSRVSRKGSVRRQKSKLKHNFKSKKPISKTQTLHSRSKTGINISSHATKDLDEFQTLVSKLKDMMKPGQSSLDTEQIQQIPTQEPLNTDQNSYPKAENPSLITNILLSFDNSLSQAESAAQPQAELSFEPRVEFSAIENSKRLLEATQKISSVNNIGSDLLSSPPKQASFGTTKPEEDQDQKCEESFEDLQAKLKQLEETMQSIDCP
ncbi:unnamed protein product [Moneuplotes crassus]|uniref:Uncharacterized protein n=1 Tax=Euplotes crassus TaxID=5936 RepID=A0AAD1XGI3_EUPCR|nr:unnamed protein product [Moneuplotes crassus]